MNGSLELLEVDTGDAVTDHLPYSKRALARHAVAVMGHLGFERFAIAGHDRGGRVAYRAALDWAGDTPPAPPG